MVSAYILGKIEPNFEKKVVSNLSAINGIKTAHATFGPYDFIAHVEAVNEAQLKNIVIEKIRNLQGIASTMTLVANQTT